ncbi:MAG: pepN 1 [Fibrobacteres bacterium]|nr:pepN 1 [Fibrobacterota bacterium]
MSGPSRILFPVLLWLAFAGLFSACGKKARTLEAGFAPAEGIHPLRLDANARPVSQELDLEIDPDSAGYAGGTSISLEILEPSDSLRLHAEDMEIKAAFLVQDGKVTGLEPSFRTAGLLTLRAKEPFHEGKAVLKLAFAKPFNTHSTSLYKVVSGGRGYVFSQFEAWDARKAFPCFDEPAFKIPWTITVRTPIRNTVIGNYPIGSERPDGARKTVTFAKSDPMPSYLVALAVGEFDTVPIPGLTVPGRVVTVKGQGRLAGFAAAMAPPILKALEGYFSAACPYPKLDLISVPEFMAGAMENPGAITFREGLILFDSSEASTARKRNLASVMAHEMSHLWFGDLVTMAWWNDLWLNESFASWMADKAVDRVYPGFKSSVSSVGGRQWAMEIDAMESSRAIRTEVLPTDNPSQSFDGLAYEKGQEVIGMLESWMGADRFQRGVQEYLKNWSWRNAHAADLWASLSRASDLPVDSIASAFLDRPGVPLVEMEVHGKILRLKQKRFLTSSRKQRDGSETGPWKIPMVIRCGAAVPGYQARYLLETSGAEFAPGTPDLSLCHPNQEERGYYRWSMPPAAMDSLAAHARDFLSERERVALVGDQDALAKAGIIGTDAMLERLRPMAKDTSPQVIQSLVEILESVDEDLIDSASAPDFAAYVSSLLKPVAVRIGWSARPGEDELVPDLRAALVRILARQGRDEKAGKVGEAVAATYLKDPRRADPSLVRVGLNIAAGRGGLAGRGSLALFRTYRTAFEKAATPVARTQFLSALGGFQDPETVDSALAYCLQGPIRAHELTSIPRGISGRREFRARTLAWVIAHCDTLIQRRSVEDAAYLPWFGGHGTPEEWALTKAWFLKLDGRVPGIAKEMEKVEAEVERLAEIRARDGERVRAYLAGRRRGFAVIR